MRRWLLILAIAMLPIAGWAQTTPRIYWDHDGVGVTHFECQIDTGAQNSLGLPTPAGTTYSALLSACGTMSNGTHLVYVRACNGTACSDPAPGITVVKL